MQVTRRSALWWFGANTLLHALDETAPVRADKGYAPLPRRIRNLWARATGTGPNALPEAVLVSLEEHASLPPLRGQRDERFLKAYLHWADRPESVGYSGDKYEGTLFADTGAHDWILFRRPYTDWQVDAPVQADPLGYALIKPIPGWNRIRVRQRAPERIVTSSVRPDFTNWETLDDRPLPDIDAAVLVAKDAVGQVISVYGSGFDGGKVELFSEDGPAEVLYAAHNQINGRVPGLHRVRVVVGGSTTPWVEIKTK